LSVSDIPERHRALIEASQISPASIQARMQGKKLAEAAPASA
jgi:hypothetical protein